MNALALRKGFKVIKNFAFKNSEVICAVAQATALVVCIHETVKAVPEVTRIIDEKKKDYESCREDDDEAKREVVWEGVKEAAPYVAKPAMAAAVCFGLIVLAPIISKKKQAALAVAYSMSEQALDAYDKHLDEVVGKKKAAEVREAVAQDRVTPFQGGGIIETGHGTHLMFMESTGVWFRSSPDYVRLVFSRLNEDLIDEDSKSFNDALDSLGLERAKLAGCHGWSAMNGERAEVNMSNTCKYVDRQGNEEAAIIVETNEQPLRSIYGDLNYHGYA